MTGEMTIGAARPVMATGGVAGPLATGAAPATLLPSSEASIDIDGALGLMMKLSSEICDVQTKAHTEHVKNAARARKAASELRSELLRRAAEAAKKAAEQKSKGGLFDFIADNLGPIGLVGLVTGAAYLVAADFVTHVTGLQDNKLDLADAAALGGSLAGGVGVLFYAAELLAKKLGPEELQAALDQGPTISDDQVRKATKIALAVAQAQLALAATVASGGTAAPAVVAMVGIGISTATQVGQEMGLFQEIFGENAARYIALGGTLLGTGLSLGGGIYSVSSASSATNAMDDIGKIATAVDRAKTVAESTHSIVQGVRNLRAAELQHDADLMHVEAQRHKRMIEFVDRMIEAVIDDLEGLQESARKATEICQSMSQTHNQTLLLAANFKG
jgi:hypothetical protein